MAVVMMSWETAEDGTRDEEDTILNRRVTLFVDSAQRTVLDILDDPTVPKLFVNHPQSQNLRLVRINPVQRSNAPRLWDVDLEYSAAVAEGPENKAQALEFLQRVEITWDTVEETEVIFTDVAGKALVNYAGDLMENLEEVISHWVIRVKAKVTKVPRYITEYDLSVNDGPLRIRGITFPKETLWLRRINISDVEEEKGFEFYVFSFELHYKSKTWAKVVPNRGFHEIIPPSTELNATGSPLKLRILTGSPAEPVAEPQWLNKEGYRPREKRADGTPDFKRVKELLDEKDLVFLRFDTKKKKNFSVLPIR